MPSCEPAELISNANCLDQCIPKGLQMAVLILLFGELIPDMPSDAETLLNDAKCLDQCIPDGAKMSVLISLACQLVEQGGSGGIGAQQVYTYAGNPNGNVLVNTTKPCICLDTINAVTWYKTDGIVSNTGWGGI